MGTLVRKLAQAKQARVREGQGEADWHEHHSLGEITRLLWSFQSVDKLLAKLLARLDQAVPMRSAVLLEERSGTQQLRRWHGAHKRVDAARIELRARQTYAYLSGETQELPEPREDEAWADTVSLPLVGADSRIFGLLQLEGATRVDLEQLTFLSMVSSHLAMALDRHYAFRQEVEHRRRAETLERVEKHLRLRERAARLAAEQAERRLAFLAEASAFLAAMLDFESTLPCVARLAVQRKIADFCAIQLLGAQPVLATRPGLARAVGEKQTEELVQAALQADHVVIEPHGPGTETTAPVGVTSIGVPLRARGRTIGVLCFGWCRARSTFGPDDVRHAEDLGRRIAMAVDNARLFREAQGAIAARENLLAVVSHDLKTPLSSIVMTAGLMLADLPREEGRPGRRRMESIMRSAERMAHLVRDLLDVATIEAGHLRLVLGATSVPSLVDELTEVLGPLAQARGLELRRDLEVGLPNVIVDRDRILQVLFNLCSNAIKFTPAGTVTIAAESEGHHVKISITDTGPGIATEHLPHVFDQFWQAKDTSHLGTGLGLFISRGIVEGHGGRIWGESAVGRGTTFHFTVPVVAR
jgi:signal transduction histidine kinase